METSVTPWNDRVCHPSSPFGVIPVPRHWDGFVASLLMKG
ncbi:hypothetical protein WANA31_1178 [Wolbachia endosymbiont of Drosophila ananassae]|nr:hypothetical protein WANA31_1178 [Wolbachia endosymbiont of Drosophila ananassae]RLT60502.1 hypothetical protein WANA34_1149 [Wolbachia endosymbiont of Drosophila ananassae]